MRPRTWLPVVAAGLALFLAACGGGGGGEEKGGGGGGGEGAKTLSASDIQNASGNVTWCIGKDTSGAYTQVVQAHNAQSQVKVKLLELPESADEQRTQQVQRLRAKSPDCDVLGMDVIWTGEYASQNWVYDLSDYIESRKDDFISSTVDSATYQGKVWAVPFDSNSGFLFYRSDQVNQAPDTWQQAYQEAQQDDGLIYQGASYEGLTVNFLELLFGAGGKVLSDDGKSAEIDSQETRDVLAFMRQGISDGAVPKAVTTYKEEESRRAFESGKATFMRNWPYAYALGEKSPIKGKFAVTPFPKWEGGEAAGILGGYNLGISAYSDNPEGSLEFVDFASKPAAQKLLGKVTLPPVLTESYDDPAVKKAMPFAEQLRTAIGQAKPRPVSPVYPQISEAIYRNVYSVLQGRAQPDAAAKNMQSQIEKALQTF